MAASPAMMPAEGLRFVVERVGESARTLIAQHFLALPPQDRYLRFGTPVGSPRIAAYVEGIDLARDAVLAVRDAATSELAGIVHAAFDGDEAELGVSVLPAHRNRGIGRALLEGALAQAGNRGMRRLWMHFLPHNAPIARLARKLGMRIASQGLLTSARLELAAAATKETNSSRR